MRRGRFSRRALGRIGFALVCAAVGLALGFAASAHALEPSAALTDTEPPPAPTPDPAPTPPPPQPRPKPVAKPSPAPVYRPPVHTTYAPGAHSGATRPTAARSRRADTKLPVSGHATRKPATPRAKPRVTRKPRVTHVVAQPKSAAERVTKSRFARIHVGPQTAAFAPAARDGGLLRSFVIAGLTVAALLFLLVVALPSTQARFTAPGRVLMDHQIDVVLAGVAALVLTGILFAIAGTH